jgi:arsenate reductase-like glutaredoxin family protein
MVPKNEMLEPATKADLKELATKTELEKLIAELGASKEELQRLGAELWAELASKEDLQRLGAELATKRELELWGGALKSQIDERDRTLEDRLAERLEDRLAERLAQTLGQRLSDEFARWAKALDEMWRSQFRAVDDKYADLPPRVTRLEAKVFPPRRTRRR